jgi:L-lactate dehydrogenase (cytochrome)
VIISGKVYDVTSFLNDHPGGAGVILRYGGRDATEEYDPIHAPGTIERELDQQYHLGDVDPSTVVQQSKPNPTPESADPSTLPPLSSVINLHDFEKIAQRFLTERAWAYYSSSADDGFSLSDNQAYWRR